MELSDVVPDPTPVNWEPRAACLGVDPNEFYAAPGRYYPTMSWRDSCTVCPVRAECLAHALLYHENFGVWGGLTPAARQNIIEFLEEGVVSFVEIEVSFRKARVRARQQRQRLRLVVAA